ncbi:MAG: hypothetical protein RL737_442 [Bacteroidota bacterium]
MSAVRDPGRDGDLSLSGNNHGKVATDAFGYTLGYFAGDYNPIGTFTTASKFEASTAGSDLLAARSDLWNGNISHMVTCLPKASDYAANQTITPEAFGSAYKYDQLNRLSSSRVFTNINTTTNQWQSGAVTNPTAYATDYTYDAMGNILSQKRNGGGASPTALDELTYNYHTTTDGLVSNRLYQVNDVVSAGNYTDDIDDQGTFNNTHSTIETANNYGYDELGNLVRDAQEEIASIEWTVYGKMKKITRNSGSSKADLEFGYDASGNRLWKKVTPKGSGAVILTYYYLRDAQGNEMCRYVKYTNTTSQLMYVAEEHSIYGSSRVGVDNRKDTLYMGAAYTPTWGGVGTSRRELGLKSFELANHLGNVLVTVSDKPIYKVSSGTIHFNPEVSSISDYYPFGAPIQGRSFSSTEYRFGYNTQEKTDEIAGPGNHNTATFWEYDTRLGRRWNIDPVTKPWESLYACLSNNPILLDDPDGDFVPIIVAGLIGAAGGAIYGLASRKSWTEIGALAAGGFVAGSTFGAGAFAVTATGVSVSSAAGAIYIYGGSSIIAGVLGNATEQLFKNFGTNNSIDKNELILSGVYGIPDAIIGRGVGQVAKGVKRGLAKYFSSNFTKETSEIALKEFKKDIAKDLRQKGLGRRQANITANKALEKYETSLRKGFEATKIGIEVTGKIVEIHLTAVQAGAISEIKETAKESK